MTPLRTVQVTRYVTPLREGGSMPAIVEADDGFCYVLKFRGAGQGIKALIAELIGSEIARTLGFKVPELVFMQLDASFGSTEPDEEIQDLLKASTGLNLGLHYLSGAITYDPVSVQIPPELAAEIVWLDAFLSNMDRTARNTNMLLWHKELWLIDHGASLYFHHAAPPWEEQALSPFSLIRNHVLLPQASNMEAAAARLKIRLEAPQIRNILQLIPTEWLQDPHFEDPEAQRTAYQVYLEKRLAHSAIFEKEIQHARQAYL